ncbi:hypothetical protein ASPWEDRAFT_43363 [Aspergillus wentii DTO 134E9]|uniref:Uncharacterized protein n=1 Tax=Aspergillus wentii DTO 134E9 TaxID=1073089 RepID=A0A1L9REI2_ASPWE|nr:uncharacterized protein ASPWEDRAFT_43363 [Aspergillus wentii DTO 134E9]OJJ33288.1 hypothetical protein ASPWEDRAFT_43363 [Aspergillus wentii DTO 134E9]
MLGKTLVSKAGRVVQVALGTVFAIIFPPLLIVLVVVGIVTAIRYCVALSSQIPAVLYELMMWFTA